MEKTSATDRITVEQSYILQQIEEAGCPQCNRVKPSTLTPKMFCNLSMKGFYGSHYYSQNKKPLFPFKHKNNNRCIGEAVKFL
jgi:thioredoxin-related protein